MTIVVTGAGSGGHITPILAVAHELKRLDPQTRIVYIGQSGDKLADVPRANSDIDESFSVSAGKLRRYHQSGLREIFDIPTHLKNLRDIFRVLKGTFQSYRLLGKVKPDVIFIKGGYIGVPVGISAAIRHIPYVTHDSDAVPGLANRIISRWAKIHTTGLPKEYYSYSPDKTIAVGVPVSTQYKRVDEQLKKAYRQELKLDNFNQVLLVTGGGLGAQRVNDAVAKIVPDLLKKKTNLVVIHLVGRGNYEKIVEQYNRDLTEVERGRVIVKDFITDLQKYSGAADLIITRAGATNLAEFAIQAKACVVIPNPFLVGGHQLVNAKVLAQQRAIKIVDENQMKKDPSIILGLTLELLDSETSRNELSNNLAKLAQPDSAEKLAKILLGLDAKK